MEGALKCHRSIPTGTGNSAHGSPLFKPWGIARMGVRCLFNSQSSTVTRNSLSRMPIEMQFLPRRGFARQGDRGHRYARETHTLSRSLGLDLRWGSPLHRDPVVFLLLLMGCCVLWAFPQHIAFPKCFCTMGVSICFPKTGSVPAAEIFACRDMIGVLCGSQSAVMVFQTPEEWGNRSCYRPYMTSFRCVVAIVHS